MYQIPVGITIIAEAEVTRPDPEPKTETKENSE
jgi:hypothetical protein